MINPITGKEESVVGIDNPAIQSSLVKATEEIVSTPTNTNSKALTEADVGKIDTRTGQEVSSVEKPVVIEEKTLFNPQGNDAVVDIEEEKKGVTPKIDFNEESVQEAITRQKLGKATDTDKELIAQFQTKTAFNRVKGLDAFGNSIGASTTAADDKALKDAQTKANLDIQDIQAQTKASIEANQKDIDARLAQTETEIQNRGKERMNTLDRGLSFSGFGRSSVAVQKRDEVQQSINQEISIAQAKAQAEAQLFKAQQEGASAETISAIQKNISDAATNLKKVESENAIAVAKMNQELGLKAEEALNNFLNATSGGIEAKDKGYDKDASLALGYVSDKFGTPLITNEKGEPIAYKGNDLGSDVKISTFKDGNENTYVYKNGMLDSIIQNDGNILSGEDVKTSKVPAEIQAAKSNKDMIDLEQQLRKEFNSNGQIKTFSDIKSAYQRVQAGAQADTPAGDLALIFSFMKMLDPGSVVREGEFATAQNATGVPTQIVNLYNKVLTGKRLGDNAEEISKQRKDFLQRAEDIFEKEKENSASVRDQFKRIADDAGVRSDFIIGAFDELADIQKPFKLEEDEENELNNIFGDTGGNTGASEFKSKSGKTFKLNLGGNSPDQTGITKGIDFSANQDIINKYPREAAFKNNNPTGITFGVSKKTKDLLSQNGIVYTQGTPRPANEGGNYFKFPDVETGLKAYQVLLTQAGTNDVYNRLKQWVGTAEGDSYASNLIKQAGITKGAKFSDLNEEQLSKLMAAQLKKESPNFYKELFT